MEHIDNSHMEESEGMNLKEFAEQTYDKNILSETDAIDNLQKHFAKYAQSVTELSSALDAFPAKYKKQFDLGKFKGLSLSEEDNMKRMNKLLINLSKKKTVVVPKEKNITPALQEFLGYEQPLAIRPNAQQFITQYINTHSLTVEGNKAKFTLDQTLATLFGKQVGEEYLKIQVNGLLSQHFN